jgi:hypothetical protein
MISFSIKDTKIVVPTQAFMLRVNKKAGCFSIGDIADGDINSYSTNARGKWLEGVILNVDTNLFGIIGKGASKPWSFTCLLVTKSDDARIRPGVVIHFPVYGMETEFFKKLQTEQELAEIFGEESTPQILRVEFSQSIQTKYGSVIKPPVFSLKADMTDKERLYMEGAETLLLTHRDKVCVDYSTLPEFLPVYDGTTGEFIRGLLRSTEEAPLLMEAKVDDSSSLDLPS